MDEAKEAETFGNFFIEKMENRISHLGLYFNEDVVLDFFGRTIKKNKAVLNFMQFQLASVKHIMLDFKPAKKIEFRESHVIKIPKTLTIKPSYGLVSPPRIYNEKSEIKTPKKQIGPSTSRGFVPIEKPKPASHHIIYPEVLEPTAKKLKLRSGEEVETVEGELREELEAVPNIKYVVAEGCIEFHKPSTKQFQKETKWQRPCKLSIAYSCNNPNDYTIYLIIYEGNMKCRRNLMKEFESSEDE